MSANYLWRAVCRAARALGRLHAEQVQAWQVWAQANRTAVPAEGPLRWVSTLDGRRLAGRHLPAGTGAGETP
jgi:hypothetical protein